MTKNAKSSIYGRYSLSISVSLAGDGCNCFCNMGAGIAVAIKKAFPEAYQADLKTVKGSRGKLGQISVARVTRTPVTVTVINAYTQFDFWGPGIKADYAAIGRAMAQVKQDFSGARIGYPLLGAGLAGGTWETIASIIENALAGENHTLVLFQPEK